MMLQALLFKFTLELTYVVLVYSEWIYESVIYFLNIKKKKMYKSEVDQFGFWKTRNLKA